jgi:hypothetical protein
LTGKTSLYGGIAMAIAGIQIFQNTYAPFNTSKRVAATPQESAATQTDTVRISQEAKSLQAGSEEKASEQDLPVEAYSLPKWYGELSSDLLMVDTEIGISYAESNSARYDALSGAEKKDLSEYQDKLHTYFQEELRNHGIESSADYYNQIVRDPEKSEEVHQAVKQKLLADTRAMQLMQYFDIAL